MNIFQIYETYVSDRPVQEQLQLATLILRRCAPLPVVDESEEWTEQDLRDWTRYSLIRDTATFGEEE